MVHWLFSGFEKAVVLYMCMHLSYFVGVFCCTSIFSSVYHMLWSFPENSIFVGKFKSGCLLELCKDSC